MNPYQVVNDFEQALCEYTGAKYAVAVTSCTMALLLALKYSFERYKENEPYDGHPGFTKPEVSIPKRTYVSVPQSIIHAGFNVVFDDRTWEGMYQLSPYPIWDSARLFTSGMYQDCGRDYYHDQERDKYIDVPGKGNFICVSFHWSKTLAIGQGGAIFHDDPEADKWFRKARFDGRTEGVAPKDDHFDMIGYHCYMSPRDAAEGLSRLAELPEHNDPLPNDDYPDLSKVDIFK